MHPDIKKFWENFGRPIGGYSFSAVDVWFVRSDPEYYDQGGPPPPLNEDIIFMNGKNNPYRMHGQWYSEEEMLKIIKMKAFL
jgi:hypothetical protein